MTWKHEDLLIFVIGATGTGKSKLAIDIATHLKGEVINADALQLYKGLDIVTNKVTNAEQNSIKHHLLAFADPLIPLTVVDFKKLALPCLKDLSSRKITPVIAGGTMYYMESLLWKVLVDDHQSGGDSFVFEEDKKVQHQIREQELETPSVETIFKYPIVLDSFKNVPSCDLHKILMQLDHEAANQLHPNNKRKIIRALQVLQRHESKYSDIIHNQRSQVGGSRFGGSLRFPNAVMFWTQCEESVLNRRLDDRVDQMLATGLLDELEAFFNEYESKIRENGLKPDYTQSIFQAIGFKEFRDYLRLDSDKRTGRMLQKCVNEMKLRTRLYARKQIKWIRSRFIHASDRPVPPIFGMDTTNVDVWDVVVRDRAFQILNHLQNDSHLPPHLHPLPRVVIPDHRKNEKGLLHCHICNRTIDNTFQFDAHLKSKGHRAACLALTSSHGNSEDSGNKA